MFMACVLYYLIQNKHPREEQRVNENSRYAWNSQDRDVFEERHADNVAVFWPTQTDPTIGVDNRR